MSDADPTRAKIRDLIARLTRKAAELQHYADHGSTMSTMREDMADGEAAKALRAVIAELKSILEEAPAP